MNGRKAAMSHSIHPTINHLCDSVLTSPGEISSEERQRIAAWSGNLAAGAAGQQFSEPLASLITKVTYSAYRVTDEDIESLREAGYSEDAIFEVVTSAAVGAAMRRYTHGMAALHPTKGASDATHSA
jgi:hypothetical protein